MILISQDGLKAIDTNKIDFYYILPEKNIRGKYLLQAKSPKSPTESGYYDFLNLFEHEDIDVVKTVMRFLVICSLVPKNDNILTIDLPELNKLGFQKFTAESETDFKQRKKADKLVDTLPEAQELIRKPTIEYEVKIGTRSFDDTAELIKKICERHNKYANLKIIVKPY